MFVNEVGVFVDSPMQHVHTLGLLFVTPYKNYFLADENKISADGNFVSQDVIGIISVHPFGLPVRRRRTVSPKASD